MTESESIAELKLVLRKLLEVYNDLAAWQTQGEALLRVATRTAEGLPQGWVWQNDLRAYMLKYDDFEVLLNGFAEDLVALKARPEVESLASQALPATKPEAVLNEAISDLQFFTDPKTGQEAIAYKTRTVARWLTHLEGWINRSRTRIRKLLVEAK